jgi:regulator of protease activity HflC (stomatin/prohibitin superfamily)
MRGDDACVCCCLVCVQESSYAVVQRFSKHEVILEAGPHCIMWPIDEVFTTMSLRLQYLETVVSTKTMDNVGIDCALSVQYQIKQEKNSRCMYDAVYSLTDVGDQINSFVEDVIRGTLPRMTVDEIFASKAQVSNAVQDALNEKMAQYGYDIQAALITNLVLDYKVAASMNEINASARLREASKEKAEAEKILLVKNAEADAEAKYLLGAGVAKQRSAIVNGLQMTVNDFASQVEGSTPKDVMDLLLMTQYFDTLKHMGKAGEKSTLFLPHGPHSINDLRTELKNTFNKAK